MFKRFNLCLSIAILGAFFISCSDDSYTVSEGTKLCGNGNLDDDEKCDDGNAKSGDGCSAKCRIEKGYKCPEAGQACVQKTDDEAVCGDGGLDNDEDCDDGNKLSGDGCSSKCEIEKGYKCPEAGEACVKDGGDNDDDTAVCGNGKIESGETCDDGNAEGGDGCSAKCKIEDNYDCEVEGKPCKLSTCGNGELDDGEDCDEGSDAVDYDFVQGACNSLCHFARYCGDGIVDFDDGEDCDSGGIDTHEEYNGCTLDCLHAAFYCGDGLITHSEVCDDGNNRSGDGCSSECILETGYNCKTPGQACTKINTEPSDPALCGNGVLDEGETCDDGNKKSEDGCSVACVVEQGWMCPDGKTCKKTTCGDGVIEGGETCDDGNAVPGDGCSDICMLEPGWICSEKDGCYALMCGDGVIAGNEECDDRNTVSGDGCSRFCKRESGYHCDVPGSPCVRDECGDGLVTGDEVCDEGSNHSDGCQNCQTIAFGWKCEVPGVACTMNTACGDGKMEGAETCEENSPCCQQCNIQPHCKCDADGKNCVQGNCGNNIVEAGEECDDGNKTAGDGCDPFCKRESIFTCSDSGSCKPICGDGITVWAAGEECDDGNLTSGDGCSSQCKVETGFSCTKFSEDFPETIQLPVTYRDFRGFTSSACQRTGGSKVDGCITNEEAALYGGSFSANHGHPDFERVNCGSMKNMVQQYLDAEGRPVLNNPGTSDVSANSFKMWYRDYPGINQTLKEHITFKQKDKKQQNDVYFFDSGNFFPLTNKCYGNDDNSVNFHFTSHMQTYFKYNGKPATLDFRGDDDVWVFVNNKLAMDLGGVHSAEAGNFKIGAENHPDTGLKYDKNFDLYEGGIYPITFFQAERHTSASSFRLTLTGFVNMGESACDAICGDGVVRGNEECDIEGHVDDEDAKKAGCVNCKITTYCGNNVREGDEECDGGDGCTPDCKYLNNQCGDGVVQPPESCDDGEKNGTPESNCRKNCQLAGCGNGVLETGEDCDDGNTSNEDNCTSECKKPVCGDGIVQGWLGEVCDDGINDGSYNGCGLGCAYLPPRCGDAVVDTSNGEQCDDGVNSGAYGTCTPDCKLPIRCGDGVVQKEYGEECDPGSEPSSECVKCLNSVA